MKKLLGILVLGLLWCNTSNAVNTNKDSQKLEEECLASGKTKSACKKELWGWTVNEYLKDGYIITSQKTVSGQKNLKTIFILKRRTSIVICEFDHFFKSTTCLEP